MSPDADGRLSPHILLGHLRPLYCTHPLGSRAPSAYPPTVWVSGASVRRAQAPGEEFCAPVLLCCLRCCRGQSQGAWAITGDRMSPLPSVALSLQATETGESRGQDNSVRRGPQRRGARVPRSGTTELGEHLIVAGVYLREFFPTLDGAH